MEPKTRVILVDRDADPADVIAALLGEPADPHPDAGGDPAEPEEARPPAIPPREGA